MGDENVKSSGLQSIITLQREVITTCKLSDKNYSQWSRTARLWFKSQGKYVHLIDNPSTGATLDQWEQQDANLITLM